MRAHRIEGSWPASERVLVLVDSAQGGNTVVRHAIRMADRLHAQWTAIHVETTAAARANEAERDKIAQTLRLAQRLGATAISIPGQDEALTVTEYAQSNYFTRAALIASNLAARVRAQAVAARERARITEELYLFSRKLAGTAKLDDLLWATAHQIALMLKVRVVLLLPETGGLAVKAGFPPEDMLDEADLAAARWCFEKNQATGCGTDTLPGAKRRIMPLRTGRGAVGVAGIDSDKPGLLLTPEESRLLDALSDQAALAIDRVNLAAEIDRARLAVETDRLRSALLTSISHDLRTPLASILGSATSLISHGCEFDKTVQTSLLHTIQEEAERLNRFIGNLLDMTRLESGALTPQNGPVDLSDIIGATVQRASKILQNHQVEIDLEPNLPMIRTDMVLMQQVLFNLLDNAAKYAPPGSRIEVAAARENGFVAIRVLDEGDGIPEANLERVFDTSSTGFAVATASAPARGSDLRSAAVSSRPWEAGLRLRTGLPGKGRFLRSRFRRPARRRRIARCHDTSGRTAARSHRRRRAGDRSLS